MKELVSLLPLIAIALIFWLFIIRPASRRNRQMARLQAGLEPGNRVMTTAGILGTVRGIHDDRVALEIADGVVIEVVRAAIGSVVTDPPDGAVGASGSPDQEPDAGPAPEDSRPRLDKEG